MNNKRQTIWLVSMLSLMVILSAYYLFTEDAPSTNPAGGGSGHLLESSGANPDGVEITQIDTLTDDETSGVSAEGITEEGDAVEDQEVLKGIANAAGNERIDQLALEQRVKISQRAEELETIIGDTKATQEEATAAAEEYHRLQDLDSRITSLQDKLLLDFDNAVVSEEENNSFKVIVLSDKLEKKQAIGIVDLATKELEVGPDRITVQYVQ
ncbi:SpoIIIAH-like family protein [Paenibacillaceae bacterium WGS1546]|uniref:SpoIIIAH-like family protein n=1 Tax=Cohnella sp. WGS1546 TaxID=3366810 RepID=UPI00372D1DB6